MNVIHCYVSNHHGTHIKIFVGRTPVNHEGDVFFSSLPYHIKFTLASTQRIYKKKSELKKENKIFFLEREIGERVGYQARRLWDAKTLSEISRGGVGWVMCGGKGKKKK